MRQRFANVDPANAMRKCSIPGCTKPTALASGGGLSPYHCRLHVAHKARHGSPWHGTYPAAERRPYQAASESYIADHRDEPSVALAITRAAALMEHAGSPTNAQDAGQSPVRRGRAVLARLRDAGATPESMLGAYLGIAALVADDPASDRCREFVIVQAAKVVLRRASGFHKGWQMPVRRAGQERTVELRVDVYTQSSGGILRYLGGQLERVAGSLADAVPDIVDAKIARFGELPRKLDPLRFREHHWPRKTLGNRKPPPGPRSRTFKSSEQAAE